MDVAQVRKRILDQYGIRVEPEMSAYVLRQMEQVGKAMRGASIPIMGGHARTGIPVREMIDPARLTSGDGVESV